MSKNSYNVSNSANNRHDSSFRSCLCALLVFLAVCIIILLAATLKWSKQSSEESTKSAIQSGEPGKEHDVPTSTLFRKLTTKIPTTTNYFSKIPESFSSSKNLYNTKNPSTDTSTKGIVSTTINDGHYESTSNSKISQITNTTAFMDELSKSSTNFDRSVETTLKNVVDEKVSWPNFFASTSQEMTEESAILFPDKFYELTTNRDYFDFKKSTTSSDLNENTFISTTLGKNIKIPESTITSKFDRTSELLLNSEATTEFKESNEIFNKSPNYALNNSDQSTIGNELFTTSEVTETTSNLQKIALEIVESDEGSYTVMDKNDTLFISTQKTTSGNNNYVNELSTLTTADFLKTTKAIPLSTQILTTQSKSVVFKKDEPVCGNSACNLAASRMLSLMNHSISPCEDFYEFACGGVYHHAWDESADVDSFYQDMLSTHLSAANNLSSSKYHLDAFNDLKVFYESCVEHENQFKYNDRISKVKNLSALVGSFQRENDSLSYDLTDLFAMLIQLRSMPLFDIGLDIDRQSSNYILQLTLPGESSLKSGLDNWSSFSLHKERCLNAQKSKTFGFNVSLSEIYESYLICQKDYARYLNSVENVVRDLGIFSDLNETQLRKEIKEIRFTIEFSIINQFHNLPRPNEIRNNLVENQYDVRKISDLQAQFSILNWKRLFNTLTGHNIYDNTTIQIYFGNYFKGMFTNLSLVNHRKLNNALLAIYVNDLYENTVIPKETQNREKFCVNQCKKLMPDISNYILKSSKSAEEFKSSNQIIGNVFKILKRQFSQSFDKVEWINDNLKILFLNKLNQFELFLFNNEDLQLHQNSLKFYDNVILERGSYQENLVTLLNQHRKNILSLEGAKVDHLSIFNYFLDPFDVRPITFYSKSIIAVPVGLTRRTSPDLPRYLIMARIGFHLAKEIARHFDPTGIKYIPGNSELNSLKSTYNFLASNTDNTLSTTSPRMFGNQNISFAFNLSLSTNERIIENAALRLIFDSLAASEGDKDLLPWISGTYSREKVFFIAVAQEFCKKMDVLDFMIHLNENEYLPSPLRVENIMQNSEAFSGKFLCPEGSGMNMFLDDEKIQFPYLKISSEDGEYDAEMP